jgi:hypothetical protein
MDNIHFHVMPESSVLNNVRNCIRDTRDRFNDTGCAETAAEIDQPVGACTFPAGRLNGRCTSFSCHACFAKLYLGLAPTREHQQRQCH